ncbi:MAG: glycosyltransferase family 2 protein [Bacteroidales bacterium]|jgi:GT2 family glycosyltransferase|nr:glycosyltransferase family 2 protein [Bacteroidales bacterium]
MLSVLIPIYNYNAVQLVENLHQQAVDAKIEFEILLLDDLSENTECRWNNLELRTLKHVTLFELPTKAGRAVARNFLAGQAKYDYLLFLDCDSQVVDNQFINRYLECCKGQNVIVCGGTAYKSQKPERDSYLRWKYGIRVEEKSAAVRNKNPNARFSTFNFLISKDLFRSILFNEMLKNYGHEDTVFGLELKERGYKVTYIDNPLYHTGIDKNEIYLKKTREGVENLKILLSQFPQKEILTKEIRLLRYYQILKKTHTVYLFYKLYSLFKVLMLRNFNSEHPNLFLFNLYKLGYLCSLYCQKEIL